MGEIERRLESGSLEPFHKAEEVGRYDLTTICLEKYPCKNTDELFRFAREHYLSDLYCLIMEQIEDGILEPPLNMWWVDIYNHFVVNNVKYLLKPRSRLWYKYLNRLKVHPYPTIYNAGILLVNCKTPDEACDCYQILREHEVKTRVTRFCSFFDQYYSSRLLATFIVYILEDFKFFGKFRKILLSFEEMEIGEFIQELHVDEDRGKMLRVCFNADIKDKIIEIFNKPSNQGWIERILAFGE